VTSLYGRAPDAGRGPDERQREMKKWIRNAGRFGLGVFFAAGLVTGLPAQDRKTIQFDPNQGKAALSDPVEEVLCSL